MTTRVFDLSHRASALVPVVELLCDRFSHRFSSVQGLRDGFLNSRGESTRKCIIIRTRVHNNSHILVAFFDLILPLENVF